MSALQSLANSSRHLPRALSARPLVELLQARPGGLTAVPAGERRQLYRYLHTGMTWVQADWWAVHYGYHPATVWRDAWWRGGDG